MKNQFDAEKLLKRFDNREVIEAVKNGDTFVKVNEPDQNMLNYMVSNSYDLLHCKSLGNSEDGMSYDCIFGKIIPCDI